MKKIVYLSLVLLLIATGCEKKTSGSSNGHEWVDLGLTVKWATCNIGATAPEGYGDYYAWGGTTTKKNYTSFNCVTYGKEMGDIAGNPKYDAARANWGGKWRMPTQDEIDELINNCHQEWTTRNGVNGYKVTGPNGNSIFLPAAGCYSGSEPDYDGHCGYYWSSTPDEDHTGEAYQLEFDSEDFGWDWDSREYARPVRAVIE